ncbi:hypothetical protein FOZ63_013349, partial [Perkinsus olseni]
SKSQASVRRTASSAAKYSCRDSVLTYQVSPPVGYWAAVPGGPARGTSADLFLSCIMCNTTVSSGRDKAASSAASTTSSSESTCSGEPRLPLQMEISLRSKSLVTMMSVRSKEWSVMDDLWRTSSMLNRRERRPGVNMDVDTLRVENMTWRMRNKWKNHVPSEIDYVDDASPDSAGVDESCKGLLDVIKDHNEDIEVETSRILAGAPFASTSLSS